MVAAVYLLNLFVKNKVAGVLNTFLAEEWQAKIQENASFSRQPTASFNKSVSTYFFVKVSTEATAHISDVRHIKQDTRQYFKSLSLMKGTGRPQAAAIPDAHRLVR